MTKAHSTSLRTPTAALAQLCDEIRQSQEIKNASGADIRSRLLKQLIEIITLSFEAIEIVSLLSNLKLKIMDVLKIILPQSLPLLHLRRLDFYCRHGSSPFLEREDYYVPEEK
ncbi:hypothetical protein LguiB_012439 [Lonicera macranthoides]